MAVIKNPEKRFWRTDVKTGRSIHALLTNDPELPSDNDPLIGVMEKSSIADEIVATHNALLKKYGHRYLGVIQAEANL